MLDRILRPVIDPPLNAVGRGLARVGVTANAVTVCGGALALLAAAAIASGRFGLGLALIIANRIVDGLDGAVARVGLANRTGVTDTGGYLDSLFDYVFYASIPLAFAFADPARNALPAAAVLASFLLTASSFLAYAALAAKRAITSSDHGGKSFYYSRGLIEGTEDDRGVRRHGDLAGVVCCDRVEPRCAVRDHGRAALRVRATLVQVAAAESTQSARAVSTRTSSPASFTSSVTSIGWQQTWQSSM